LGVIDGLIKEPLGGAHRNPPETAENVKSALIESLNELGKIGKDDLIEKRYNKFRKIGVFQEE